MALEGSGMKISVVGLGKLGKPIHDVLSEYYEVIGIDIGGSFKKLGDITFVVVPTPSLSNYKFTSEQVEDVLSKITKKQTVAIVSTIMPGETDRLQAKYPHLKLIYNPTFVALGSVEHDFTNPDIVLIGGESEKLIDIYRTIIKSKPFYAIMTPLEAEIAKLSLNCYITTKITFANQIGNLCHRIGIKPHRILQAIGHDSRVGEKYFHAGLGYGGPCFPRDNLALSAYMIDNGYDPKLARTVHQLNEEQVMEIVGRIEEMNAINVGFAGLSYKPGTDVTEKSQLLAIHDTLKARGYDVKVGEKSDVNLDWSGVCE
jgi:UDPglucose 6-dehydrogenase